MPVRVGLLVAGVIVLVQVCREALRRRPVPRTTVVPELRGLGTSDAFVVAARARVRLRIHRLTDRPAPVEGVVVGQRPEPGTRVSRDAEIDVDVHHPPEPDQAE